MDKGTVVCITCQFKRGGFPSERAFEIATPEGVVRGVADVEYCRRMNMEPLGEEPSTGHAIPGLLMGLVIRPLEGKNIRVHLPDGGVYDLDTSIIEPAREVVSRDVPV